ncbi:MAG TPA: hypothetical protein VLF69_01660 [Candidatus Saccharimonadales bacterium]|nr:hypothetical protein [Candidatus Saccharimonadales bacterium]
MGVLALSVLLSQDACGTTGPGHPLETATISDTPFYSKPNLRYICFVAIDEPATHITLVDEHDGFVAFDVASTGKPGLPPTDSACAKADDHSEVWVPKTALSDIQPGG